VPEIAWCAANSGGTPHAVGQKRPNAYGLYDMLGNVREWVLDRYYVKYDLAAPAPGENVEQPLAPNASTVAREDSGRVSRLQFTSRIDPP
jgi:formylglycine-generating enzyme required for sulfatase activity